jgi:hypothetical protein
MRTEQVNAVKPGGTILHPETRIPLRVVQLKDARVRQSDPLQLGTDTVIAVDDEGGLYAFDATQQVEVPFSVPLVTRPSSDNYIIVASFERQLSDDLPVLVRNLRDGRITVDPKENLPLAAMQQLALELGLAYDEGMEGVFQGHRMIEGRAFDKAAMGWTRTARRT